MATRNFRSPASPGSSSIGTISVHISSTNTQKLQPEKVTNLLVKLLKENKLDVGTVRLETVLEAQSTGISKTIRVLYVVSDPTED